MSDTEQHSLEARVAAMETMMTIAIRRLFAADALDKEPFLHEVQDQADGLSGEDEHAPEAAALLSLTAKL